MKKIEELVNVCIQRCCVTYFEMSDLCFRVLGKNFVLICWLYIAICLINFFKFSSVIEIETSNYSFCSHLNKLTVSVTHFVLLRKKDCITS